MVTGDFVLLAELDGFLLVGKLTKDIDEDSSHCLFVKDGYYVFVFDCQCSIKVCLSLQCVSPAKN